MIVLGISAYSHESSACILKDGIPLAVIEEERVNRKKHTWEFPVGAIREVLNICRINPKHIDAVAVFWNPWKEITGNVNHVIHYLPESLNLLCGGSGSDDFGFIGRIFSKLRIKRDIQSAIPGINSQIKIHFIDHQLTHAASCFHVSPFNNAAIFTMDGRGETSSAFMGTGRGNSITGITEWPVPHSLGHLYSAVTDYLGFRSFFDEFKVTGLAAYGTATYYNAFRDLVAFLPNGSIKLDLSYFKFHTHGRQYWLSDKFYKRFGPPRLSDGILKQHHCDIACSLQKTVEVISITAAKYLREQTGNENLVMAGGVLHNCQLTKKIVDQSGFKNIFITPLANDAGTSLGSALYYTHCIKKKERKYSLDTVFLGPEYSDETIKAVLESYCLPYTLSDNLAVECAKYIAEGKIVGWFQGRMECGPRALGNRSLLVDPRNKHMRDLLNRKIKKREPFRPFAASVLYEHASDYFDLSMESPYMLLASHVKQDVRDIIPAVIHKDGTTRIQTVRENANTPFRQLIEAFYELTGIPLVLNTSFNENEPIVMTPEDSIRCFLRTGIDVLGIGSFIVRKPLS